MDSTTKLAGQLKQIAERLLLTWEPCPRNFSSYSPTQREQHGHAYGYCHDGMIETGYSVDRRVCHVCKGAGEVLR